MGVENTRQHQAAALSLAAGAKDFSPLDLPMAGSQAC